MPLLQSEVVTVGNLYMVSRQGKLAVILFYWISQPVQVHVGLSRGGARICVENGFFQKYFSRSWVEKAPSFIQEFDVNFPGDLPAETHRLIMQGVLWHFWLTLNQVFAMAVSQILFVGQNNILNIPYPEVAYEIGYKLQVYSQLLGTGCDWLAVMQR